MSDLIERLRRFESACTSQATIHRTMNEAADRITELEAELTEWEKLKDPINLHVNLLRGVPCKLDRIQHLLHLAGATDYDYLKAANAKMRKCLEAIADPNGFIHGGTPAELCRIYEDMALEALK